MDTVNEVRLEIRSVKETTDKQTEEHTRLTQVIKEVDRVTADEIRELRSEIRAIKETLDKLTESENTTTDKIRELQSAIRNFTNKQTEEHTRLTQVIKEVDNATGDEIRELAGTLNVLQSELRNIKNTQMEEHNELKKMIRKGSHPNPAISCRDLLQDSPSGEYWILGKTNHPIKVYCDMTRTCCTCTGGWTRVANLDVTDLSQQCPDGFRLVNRTTAPHRTCGRPGPVGCVSTTFPVHGIEYSHVCGRVIGYQDGAPNAFDPYYFKSALTIDDSYVDGISLTHGQLPRQHIWTFAAAVDETRAQNWVCPCTQPDLTYTGVVPPFIGQDYFCETGSKNNFQRIFYPDDPLWDGHGCGGNSTCCSFNNPPWFCKQLPQPTTDDIELRLCGDEVISNEDTPLEIVEIYIM